MPIEESVPHRPARDGEINHSVALMVSDDLRNWEVRDIVLYHPDVASHGFQYLDWLFEGDDLIVASRTAYADGLGGADNQHNANYLTFHRIENFRERSDPEVPGEPFPGPGAVWEEDR